MKPQKVQLMTKNGEIRFQSIGLAARFLKVAHPTVMMYLNNPTVLSRKNPYYLNIERAAN